MSADKTTAWDGYPPNPERSGYHWLRRTDASVPMPEVIWTWRADAQVWRTSGIEHTPATQSAEKEYVAPVAEPGEAERLRAEVAALRLVLGGVPGSDVPEPIGCPCPGACQTVAEIGRLRVALRVNGLRQGATDAEIDEVIYGKR